MKTSKKGGANIQLCAQEKTLLLSILDDKLSDLESNLKVKKNLLWQRDLTYYRKIYGKLTNKNRCPHCGEWIERRVKQ